ncbi:endolytic transglycosylase MltG [Desulfobulbus alkaliphilus]|uniref:endolytic transglycosylase MltG n=1 Tax=Desulfobulbus alkaliphilus TaxID=869814 RepID=UPI0019638E7A|nr:endolytic transglycosylase MltG [Desulfobulbus alkaliphilus]MBM9538033.1 endolytic transglycosylase MltG [Desulfobulbus alkaliphilus]
MRTLILSLFVVLLSAGLGIGFWFWSYLISTASGEGEVVVFIPRGAGVRDIGRILELNGVLDNDIRFLAYVRLTGLGPGLRAGEYRIPRNLTPPEVLRMLSRGETLRHQITIPEGMTVEQVASIFARDGWVDRDRFLELTWDSRFIETLGLDVPHLEGYLFPETYTLSRLETDEEILIRAMVNNFQRVWSEIESENPRGLNRHQVVTLASIVEKETGTASERPLIARVFYNRLERGMRLQSDPTVSYGLVDFTGPLTRADLRRETPYNTYVISALPPGPICNPGQAALEAVLNPVESNALYFVSRNDGTHVFSTNLKDHNRAVYKYQRSR